MILAILVQYNDVPVRNGLKFQNQRLFLPFPELNMRAGSKIREINKKLKIKKSFFQKRSGHAVLNFN